MPVWELPIFACLGMDGHGMIELGDLGFYGIIPDCEGHGEDECHGWLGHETSGDLFC